MSSQLNALLPDRSTRPAPRPRVLILAHADLAEPMARYLGHRGCDVEVPRLAGDTVEDCAALLFPTRQEATKPRRRFPWPPWNREARATPVIGPASFFAWGAYDAVIMQDLWPTAADRRMIPFGCVVTATDYYVRGNFHQPKVVVVTDPAFYGLKRQSAATCEEALRIAFDRNEQLQFVSVIGNCDHHESLLRIGEAVENGNGRKTARPKGPRGYASEREYDAPEQARALSVLSRTLAAYVASRARVVLVDDDEATLRLVAAQFGKVIPERYDGSVHVCDVRTGEVHSSDLFSEIHRQCERIVEEGQAAKELVLVVTDILFDAVPWAGKRRTGIDLIEMLRGSDGERRRKMGIIGLTGIASPLVMTSAFRRGADAMVAKSSGEESTLQHAHLVDDRVVYKLLLTMASHCFQHEFLFAKRHAPRERAREESAALCRILPSHAVSPHLQSEWEATLYLLDSQATYAHTVSETADRAVRRIREQFD